MAATNEFTEQLRTYMREQEKAPLYREEFF